MTTYKQIAEELAEALTTCQSRHNSQDYYQSYDEEKVSIALTRYNEFVLNNSENIEVKAVCASNIESKEPDCTEIERVAEAIVTHVYEIIQAMAHKGDKAGFDAMERIVIETAKAAIAAMKPKWLPIESAPKDGTNILVYTEIATQPVVHIAWYRSEAEYEESGKFCFSDFCLEEWEGWWSYTRSSVSQRKLDDFPPTHWMPLPQPPQTKEGN